MPDAFAALMDAIATHTAKASGIVGRT